MFHVKHWEVKMIRSLSYVVNYIKYMKVYDFTHRGFNFEPVEVEETLQFVKSTPAFYDFYNKQTGHRFKVKKTNVKNWRLV